MNSSGNGLSDIQRMNRWGMLFKRSSKIVVCGDNKLTHLHLREVQIFAKSCQTFDGLVGTLSLVHSTMPDLLYKPGQSIFLILILGNSCAMVYFPIKRASHVAKLEFPLSFFNHRKNAHTQNKVCM